MKKTLFMLSTVAVTAASCTKTMDQLENGPVPQYLTISEYEAFGIMHNAGLYDYSTVTNFSTQTDAYKIAYIVNWGENYLDDPNFDNASVKSNLTEAWDLVKNDSVSADYIEVQALNYFNSSIISEDVKNYLIDLSKINESGDSITTTVSHISGLESTIMADGSLSVADKDLLMGACIILRYSSNYWHTEIMDPNSAWQIEFPDFGDPMNYPAARFYRLRRAARDVWGWVDGFCGEPIEGTSHMGTASIYASSYSTFTPI